MGLRIRVRYLIGMARNKDNGSAYLCPRVLGTISPKIIIKKVKTPEKAPNH